MPCKVAGGRWQRGAESVLGGTAGRRGKRERQADRRREEEGEKTRGDFWLGVVVVREGFILLVTLELDQK